MVLEDGDDADGEELERNPFLEGEDVEDEDDDDESAFCTDCNTASARAEADKDWTMASEITRSDGCV